MTLSRRWVRGAVWVVLVIMGSFAAQAQEVSGNISGIVLSPTGTRVSGATVTLTNTDRDRVERTVTTNKTGFYSVTSLPLGHYTVAVGMKGFKAASVSHVVLHADDQLTVDQTLAAGAETETVKTVAPAARINLQNGTSEGLLTGNRVRELPVINRNFESLIALQPGVVFGGASDEIAFGSSYPGNTQSIPASQDPSGTPAANQALFSFNGLRPTENNWTVDGADNVDRGSGLTLLTYPSLDAISEIVTLRGTYNAEFGRNGGAQINVITRSGTNDFHGEAYEFFRNDHLNANGYFNNLTGTPRPSLRYNDFGFALGGPVMIPHFYDGRKHHTFFFYSQELRRVVNYSSSTTLVPTAAERTGDFSNSFVGNGGSTAPVAVCATYVLATGTCTSYRTTLQQSQIDPTAQAYVNDIYGNVPLPQTAADLQAGLDPHALTSNQRNVFNDNQEMARIDQAFGVRYNLSYRFLHDSFPSTEGNGLFMSTPGMPGVQTTQTRAPGTQHLAHITIAMRPTMLLDMGYAFSSGAVISDPIGYSSTAVAAKNTPILPSLPYASTLGIVPSLAFTAGSSTGPAPSGIANTGAYRSYDRNHNGFGDLTYIFRQHTFKFGVSYNHYQKIDNAIGNNSPYPQGLFTFGNAAAPNAATLSGLGKTVQTPSNFDASFASFLIGNASGGGSNPGFTQASVDAAPNLNENLIELYGQDQWRVTRRLSVNLGVRYSYFGQPYDVNNELSNFDPSTFSTPHAQTIDSNGQLCTTASATTVVVSGIIANSQLNNCLNTNGLNGFTPNAGADPLNGMILANSVPVQAFNEAAGAPSPSIHGSPFGLEVGHAEKHDWAPRVGFALDVFGDGRTSLRGGYGIVYDQSPVAAYEQSVFNNIPFVSTVSYSTTRLNSTTGVTPISNLTPPTLYATPVVYQTPYVQQFSVDLQKLLTPTLTLDIGYFGDHGTHLMGRVDINEVGPGQFASQGISNNGSGFSSILLGPIATNGTSATGNVSNAGQNVFNIPNCSNGFASAACELPLNQIRPFPGYGAINAAETIFNSNYNSLQVNVTKRFSGKSVIDANYTWGKSLTNAQSDFNSAPQNSYNIEPEYGRSAYDRNNVVTIDGIWDLPWMRDQQGLIGHVLGGWQLSGIYAASSGMPLTATMSAGGTVDYSGVTSTYNPALTNGGVANDSAGLGVLGGSVAQLRPNQVADPNSGAAGLNLHSHALWFNPTAFVAPPPSSYQVGNERRSTIQGPGFARLDVGVFRSFRLYKQSFFEIRGEAFNAINHVNWATVCTDATDTGCGGFRFGHVMSARDPRVLQIAGKFSF